MNRLSERQLAALERDAGERARAARVGGGDVLFFESVIAVIQELRAAGRLSSTPRAVVIDAGGLSLGRVE